MGGVDIDLLELQHPFNVDTAGLKKVEGRIDLAGKGFV